MYPVTKILQVAATIYSCNTQKSTKADQSPHIPKDMYRKEKQRQRSP
jgi:hypothetical protein